VKIAAAVAHVEGDDADAPAWIRIAEDLDGRLGRQSREGALEEASLARRDDVFAHRVLDLERQRRADDLQHARRAGLLPGLDIVDEVVVPRSNQLHRTAARKGGWQSPGIAALVEHKYAARGGSTEDLVRRDDHGVDGAVGAIAAREV